MGIKYSANEYYKKVETLNSHIKYGPPHFVKLNDDQIKLAKHFKVNFEDTCSKTDILSNYVDKLTPKKNIVSTALPNDDDLEFDKNYMLVNAKEQLCEMRINMENGFMSVQEMTYIGRLLRAIEAMIEDDIKDAEILPYKESVKESLSSLKKFCVELSEHLSNNSNVVWIISESPIIEKWNKIETV